MRFNMLSTCSGTLPRAQDPVWAKLNSWLNTICLARKKIYDPCNQNLCCVLEDKLFFSHYAIPYYIIPY